MKLLYITNTRIPMEKAHGILVMQMCEALALSNVEVELIVPKRFNKIKKDPFEYYGVKRIFKIKWLPCLDLIPLDKYIGLLGLWIESISFLFFVFLYTSFKKADVIYTTDRYLLSLDLFKKNSFFEAHAIFQNYFLYSMFLKRARGIIVTSQRIKEFFIKNGISSEKILVAPNGVDIKEFDVQCSKLEARRKLNLPQDKKIVLYTGHLYEWKGAQTLAEASQYLPENAEVYFVGGTKEDIERFKIQNSRFEIQIIGHRPRQEIPFWLKAADILVLPDLAVKDILKYGASPMKMFEYMASKKPIIASDLPTIREILNEKNAILIKPDNPKELAKGIKEILENPELSAKISNQAFQDVQQHTWQNRAKKIIEFIQLNL